MDEFNNLILMIIMGFLYFFPIIVAHDRKHSKVLSIFICNLFFGWTFIGWVISLIWACNEKIKIEE